MMRQIYICHKKWEKNGIQLWEEIYDNRKKRRKPRHFWVILYTYLLMYCYLKCAVWMAAADYHLLGDFQECGLWGPLPRSTETDSLGGTRMIWGTRRVIWGTRRSSKLSRWFWLAQFKHYCSRVGGEPQLVECLLCPVGLISGTAQIQCGGTNECYRQSDPGTLRVEGCRRVQVRNSTAQQFFPALRHH